MELAQCAALLRERDGYLILTHRRPDGDTLGSAAALCHALRRIGKTACLFANAQVTESYAEYVEPYLASNGFKPRYVISVDTAEEGMLSSGYTGRVDLVLDHHGSNSGYGTHSIVWENKASCGELILELLTELCGGIDEAEAELLYVAVSTDTGCFRYANTTADTFRAAARLVDAGAQLGILNQKLFRTTSRARLMLEGMVYSTLRSERGGRVNIAVVTLDMLEKAGATEDDCDDLASLPGRVAGNKAAVTVRELEDGGSKISLRTGSELNASLVCRKLGGGGHAMAAGCELACPPLDAADRILQAIDEVWNERDSTD